MFQWDKMWNNIFGQRKQSGNGKPSCGHLQNNATHGLNFNDDLGVVVANRNVSSWTSSNESWLFEPDGPDNYTITLIDFEPEIIVPQGKLAWAWYKNSSRMVK